MVTVKDRNKASRKHKRRAGHSSSKPKSTLDPSTLLAQAAEQLQIGNPEAALPLAQNAVDLCALPEYEHFALPALNILAQIEIELGDPDAARSHFQAAVELDPEGRLPEELGGGAEKFLWLAQLSEDGGKDSIGWFERGAGILEREIGELQGSTRKEEDIAERKSKLASALCGMIEVWMTDLS
jgi:tetratricopeptide (TPR) repeat protein